MQMFGFVTSEIEGKIKLLQKKLDEKRVSRCRSLLVPYLSPSKPMLPW